MQKVRDIQGQAISPQTYASTSQALMPYRTLGGQGEADAKSSMHCKLARTQACRFSKTLARTECSHALHSRSANHELRSHALTCKGSHHPHLQDRYATSTDAVPRSRARARHKESHAGINVDGNADVNMNIGRNTNIDTNTGMNVIEARIKSFTTNTDTSCSTYSNLSSNASAHAISKTAAKTSCTAGNNATLVVDVS